MVAHRGSSRGGGFYPVVHRSSNQVFWSDASDQVWRRDRHSLFAAGPWLEGGALLSINHRELLAVERGLCELRRLLQGQVVTVFSVNTTAVSFFHCRGRTFSPVLNMLAQRFFVERSIRTS